MSSAILVRNLKKSYPGRAGAAGSEILHGIGLQIQAGELVALVGPSGCGKSTLLNLVAGLDRPTQGSIEMAGGAALSVVFQQPRLLDWLSVEENVALAFDRARLPAAQRAQRTQELLAKVGLAEHARSYPQFLSGGQRQRVAIARAFALRPDVLLLDEPFSALDELTARKLRLLLQSLWSDGTPDSRPAGILVTHNMLEAAFLADRIYVMGGKPASISSIIEVELARPRDPDDPALFGIHRAIMRALG